MKRANGQGTIIKLSGNRRRPYAIKKTLGYDENGKHKYTYISYHKTRREAERALLEYNKDPYRLDKITFAEIYKLFIEYKDFSEPTLKKYEYAFKNFLTPLHNKNIQSLNLSEMQLYFDRLDARKDAINEIKKTLRGCFEYAAKRGYIPLSYLEMFKLLDIKPTKQTRKVKRAVFSADEIKYLWNNKDRDLYKVILFYIYTGLRFSELLNCEIYPEKKYLKVVKSKTPAGLRDVPLSKKALSLLPLPAFKYSTYRTALFDLTNHTGTDHTPHDTRHTFISLMTEADVDPRIIKKIVGHSTNDVTESVYTHIRIEKLLKEVNKI